MSATESLQAEDAYFASNPPPKQLAAHTALAEAFITQHAAANRRVVLVTSGGTTVPLEKNTVRFIDVCNLSFLVLAYSFFLPMASKCNQLLQNLY